MELRPYQVEALKASADAEKRGVTRQLWVCATGLGKTVMVGAHIAARGTPKTFGFMHREELINQAAEKLKIFNPSASFGIEKAEFRCDPEKNNIILASVQTVGRKDGQRLSRIPKEWPQYVWLDEAHHAPNDSNLTVLNYFGLYGDNPRKDILLVGSTATPDRLDEMGYDKIFDDVVYRYGLREAIKDGWLADVRAWRLNSDLDLGRVRVVKGDFVDKDLEEAIDDSRMKEVAVESWVSKCRGRRSLFFCVTKRHAHEVAEALKEKGAKAAVIVDDTPKDERKAAIAAFRKGDLEVITNCSVFSEGYDEPSIECIHILKPTRSRAAYSQMLGRGTRKTETKSFVEIYDYTAQVHDICSVGQIFGLPDSWEMKGQSVEEDAKKLEEVETELGLKTDGAKDMPDLLGRIRERRMEMIRSTLTDTGLPGGLAWIRPSQTKERWVIAWRNETEQQMSRVPQGRRREAGETIARDRVWGVHERIEVFRNELGLYEAKIARSGPEGSDLRSGKIDGDRSLTKLIQRLEKRIKDKRPYKLQLLKKDARWRHEAATDAQKEILRKKGVPGEMLPNLSKGDAAGLINVPWKTIARWFESGTVSQNDTSPG